MKKKILCILTAAAVLSCIGIQRAPVKADEITVKYDGITVDFDVPAQIIDERTMVPMRKIFEIFGSKVKWDETTQTITARKNSKTITMTIGNPEITVTKSDGTEIASIICDTPPQVVDDRTLIPIRAVGELLGLEVSWDGENKIVEITDTDDGDDSWKDNSGEIDLDAGTVSGDGAAIENGTVIITKGGDFTVTGTLENGCIRVNTEDKVKIRLSGADITNTSGPAIYGENADKLYITISGGTVNTLTDGEVYSGSYADLKGCISSKDKLEIKGSGTLNIVSSAHQGIKASDSLEISDGIINITSAKDGIRVNDTLEISGGTLNITAAGDGIASESIVDITGGDINITTTGEVTASDEQFGRGWAAPGQEAIDTAEEEETSSKGIKADWLMDISGGNINVASTDHAVHCASDINIDGGEIQLASSVKKGISAHGNITINGGSIDITQSTEGIESKKVITVNDGEINIKASDDGLNAGGQGDDDFGGGMRGNGGGMRPQDEAQGQEGEMAPPEMPQGQDGETVPFEMPHGKGGERAPREMAHGQEGETAPPEMAQGQEGETAPFEMPHGKGGERAPREMAQGQDGEMAPPEMPQEQNGETVIEGSEWNRGERREAGMGEFSNSGSTEKDSNHHIQINGGTLYINAEGDGIDSNGSLFVEGGVITVDGPEHSGDGALDTQGALMCSGGTLIAVGNAGMAEAPNSSSSQNSLSIYFSESKTAGTVIRIEDESGNELLSYSPSKSYGHAVISSPLLESGQKYKVYVDDTLEAEAEVSSALTIVGTAMGAKRR